MKQIPKPSFAINWTSPIIEGYLGSGTLFSFAHCLHGQMAIPLFLEIYASCVGNSTLRAVAIDPLIKSRIYDYMFTMAHALGISDKAILKAAFLLNYYVKTNKE
jgi:hypothetical protein